MAFLSLPGRIEMARRLAVLAALVAAVALLKGAALQGLALAVAVVVYVWPGVRRPDETLRMSRLRAIVLPDLLGFALIAFFLGLPILLGGGGLHPSAWLLWPMAALFGALPAIAAGSAAFGLRLTDTTVEVDTWRRCVRLAWHDIAQATAYRRGLPTWLRRLGPLLAAGNPTAAGALMLARDSIGTVLHARDGRRFVIPLDGFETGHAALLRALAAQGLARPPTPARREKTVGKGATP